ncbi:MAG: hypothetical protein M3372_04735 [Verrucomicrobiota bacterium]|nr:hypothetical protein [Chthoniobacterales bacterium]MDQ3626416.1 hypothetical protein [Verrucomicrobiota bacterium]
MGKRFKRCLWVLLVALGFACQPAEAGERKSGSASREARASAPADLAAPAAGGNVGARGARAAAQGDFFLGAVSPFGSTAWRSAQAASASEESKEAGMPTPPRERKKLTLFRFDPKLGDISVQPVVGGVKGAQFCVGF